MLLNLFVDYSGFQINRIKSAFFGFGPAQRSFQCSRAFGMPIETLPITLLGITIDEGLSLDLGLAASD